MRFLYFTAITLLLFTSCLGEEDITFSPSNGLVFRVDSLNLDTVIAGQRSNTYAVWAYNPNKKAIQIIDISLRNGKNSEYIVNVDGEFLPNGKNINSFEIPGRDSIRIFVEANPVDDFQDTPRSIDEYLDFTEVSGLTTSLRLHVVSQSVIPLQGVRISKDTSFTTGRPYHVLDSLVVEQGCTLNIEAGTKFLFHPQASLIVHGTIKAEGRLDSPIIFRGDRMSMMFPNQPYDRVPGQWVGIIFSSTSKDNVLYYTDIHSSKYGISVSNTDVLISNSIVHNTTKNAITAINANLLVGNTQITNSGGDCLNIIGGDNTFIHCTIARFYNIRGDNDGVALRFSNYDTTDKHIGIKLLAFYNCIITGWNEDEIIGDDCSTITETIPFNYIFDHCLLCTPQSDNINQNNCIWDESSNANGREDTRREKNFLPIFDYSQLLFTFYLNPLSLAVNSASPITLSYPNKYLDFSNDLLGYPRINDLPDIGCYELQRQW